MREEVTIPPPQPPILITAKEIEPNLVMRLQQKAAEFLELIQSQALRVRLLTNQESALALSRFLMLSLDDGKPGEHDESDNSNQ